MLSTLASWIRRWPIATRGAGWILRRVPRVHRAVARELAPPLAIPEPLAAPEPPAMDAPPVDIGQPLTAASSELERIGYLLRRAVERHSP